jgi:hypothetical protein
MTVCSHREDYVETAPDVGAEPPGQVRYGPMA